MEVSPAELLQKARIAAGLSARALAAKAGVAASTVSRIESGATDPTVGMLSRLLAAAGQDLQIGGHARDGDAPTLASLSTAARAGDDRLRVDWTRLRAFTDWCRRHPDDIESAIADPPRRTGTALDAILAGYAELLAEQAGISAPPWSRSVPVPSRPWSPPGTPAMRARAEAACPDAFRRRNIILPRDTIFRDSPPSR